MKQKIIQMLERIKMFIKKVFNRNDVLLIQDSKDNIDINNINSTVSPNVTKKQNMREQFEKERQLLELQRKYESGEIKEENLSQSQKEELKEIYKKQITTLEERKVQYQRQIDGYKRQILDAMYKLKEQIKI